MKRDKNKELMLAAGSKTGQYDPEAPDQWKWVLRHSKDPHEKAMGWIKSKTTAWLHDSPYCVDDHGKALYAEHLAVDMGWKTHTAQNVLCELESQGRIRLEKGKRIWYCADIPQAYEQPGNPDEAPESLTPEEEERRRKSERISSVQRSWGTYVADFIRNLPDEKQQNARLTKLENCVEWKREFFADLMASGRSITDRIDNTTLQGIGIPKKRLEKRRAEAATWVKLKLIKTPSFVQGNLFEASEDSVQNGNPTSYKPESDFVDARAFVTQQQQQQKSAQPSVVPVPPNGVSLSKPNMKKTAAAVLPSAAPPPLSRSPPSAPIENLVARELNLDDEAAQQLVAGCKDVEPSVTGAEIVELAREKQHAMKEQVRAGKIASPVGLLIKHVPKMCKGGTLQAVRERLEAVAKDRASRIAYAREAWPELNEEERADVLQKYPELAELAQGARA